jgi:hypothetical protein
MDVRGYVASSSDGDQIHGAQSTNGTALPSGLGFQSQEHYQEHHQLFKDQQDLHITNTDPSQRSGKT